MCGDGGDGVSGTAVAVVEATVVAVTERPDAGREEVE
jgi:hypothetical protein